MYIYMLTQNRDNTVKNLYLCTAERVSIKHLQREFTLETYNYVSDVSNDAFVLNVLYMNIYITIHIHTNVYTYKYIYIYTYVCI